MDAVDAHSVPSEILPDIGEPDLGSLDEWVSHIIGEPCVDMPARSVSAPELLVQQPLAEPCDLRENPQEICSAPDHPIIDAVFYSPQPKRNKTARPPIAKKRPREDGFWSARMPTQKWPQDSFQMKKRVNQCLMNFINNCVQK
jgi:hypothetical protein